MADLIVDFPTLPAALVFLQRESPASAEEAWARLGQIRLLRTPNSSAVALQFEQSALDHGALARAGHCGGRVNEAGAPMQAPKEHLSMQMFFRRIRLEVSSRTEQGRHFLVVPEDLDPAQITRLMEWLSEVEGCSVWAREVRRSGDEGTLTVFELHAEGDAVVPTPAGLPGAPQVLVAVDEDVFVPAGLECPLLPAHRFLFPPAGNGVLHAWMVGPKGRPSYTELTTTGTGAIPMARMVVLPPETSHVPAATGAAGRVTLPLRLRPTNAKRRLRRAAQVVYVVESRGGELGAALLRLFDHAEAGIEQFKYFNRAASAGPNALVEHFLLTDARLADDDMWPELKRFDLPRTLAEVGLPLFLPADSDFTPDLEGVISGLDADDPFLNKLRAMVGLEDAPAGRMAVIEPSSDSGGWRITTLENGRPLESLVSVVIEDWHREPVRRLLDTERVDLTDDRRRYEEQWLAVGGRMTSELAETTRGLAESLEESVRLVAGQLSQLDERVKSLREASVPGQELVSAAPRLFTAFIDGVVTLVESVAAPRREWLAAAESRRQAMESLVAGARSLQRSVQEEVERADAGVREARRELAGAGDRLTRARAALEQSINELAPQIASANAAAQQAASAIQGRHERVLAAQSEVAARERFLRERSDEVDRLQQAVQEREHEVARAAEALEARRASLEARMAAAQRAESAAKAEEARLRQVEAVELPSALRRRDEADQEAARWRARRLDDRIREVEEEIRLRDQECSQFKDQQQRLVRMSSELARLRAELQQLRASVAQLQKENLESAVQAASTELEELSSDALLLQAMTEDLQSARRLLDTAADRLRRVHRVQGIEEFRRRVEELEVQARALEAEHRRATTKTLPAELESRIQDIERTTRALRRDAGGSRSGWFGRWFGGSRHE